MLAYVYGVLCVAVVMLLLDAVWLGWLVKSYYRESMRPAITFEVHGWAAACFYVLHGLGVVFFVLHSSRALGEPLLHVLMRGFLFGLVTYGTYGFTNLATVKKWPVPLAFLDIAWGGFATMLASAAAYMFLQ